MAIEQKPKIIVFFNNPNKVGGPTISMYKLINSNLREKYEFIPVNIYGGTKRNMRPSIILKYIKKIKKVDPDVIHVSGLQFHGFYASMVSRLAGYSNILLTIHGSSTDAIDYPKIFKKIYGLIIEPLTLKVAEITYSVSSHFSNKKMIKKHGKNYYGAVPNVAPLIDDLQLEKNYLSKKYEIPKHKKRIVYTGRITREKGLDYALQAIQQYNKDDTVFILVGDGPDLEYFERKYSTQIKEERIIFLGREDNVLPILRDSDIFLFPTLHENLSNSLLEACAIGLPIIATDVGGNPDVIVSGYNGVLIPPQNTEAICKSLDYLLNEEAKAEEFGRRAKETAQTKFSGESIYPKIDKLYRKIIEKE